MIGIILTSPVKCELSKNMGQHFSCEKLTFSFLAASTLAGAWTMSMDREKEVLMLLIVKVCHESALKKAL